MTKIKEVIKFIEDFAPPMLQESYDNSKQLTGDKNLPCTGVLLTLDCTEDVVKEAIESNCNLIIAHHPIVFSGLKSLTGKNYIEQTIITAIKNDIVIYACHTNLDNVKNGVNKKICDLLGVKNTRVLSPKKSHLLKLEVFVPTNDCQKVRNALAKAGAGKLGDYSGCSFSSTGTGRFTPMEGANPSAGKIGTEETLTEDKIEVILPQEKKGIILHALHDAHPYEEVAYFLTELESLNPETGSGMIGTLEKEISIYNFFDHVKESLEAQMIKHTNINKEKIQKIAVCGGSGSFLLQHAIRAGADLFLTSDFKYHEFFDAENKIIIADIGHYETEHKTKELFYDILSEKFANIALVFSKTNTNPVKYY